MSVNGKTVFVMLFGVAVAASIDPLVGFFAFLALLAAANPRNVIQMLYALDDGVQRAQRLIEERRWPALTGDGQEETGVGEGVTTPRIYKEESPVVTLPPPSRFDPHSPRPSQFAVPLGRDAAGTFRWLDFGKDALHLGLYGTSGCGKDHLLRLWFVALLRERGAQWAILDGKGDWLTPNLARLPQMLFPPAGGYGDEGQRRIKEAIALINTEAKRRFGLLLEAGVRSVEEYNQVASQPLPLLFVLATDIIDVVDETERLLIALVSKARALGIRVIVSMQTPTGKRLEWRMNLSTLIAGALVDGSQDAPALGVRDPKALRYRPSQLPPPPAERGLFVVRHNGEQFIIRTPVLGEDFDHLVNEHGNAMLLEALLAGDGAMPHTHTRITSGAIGEAQKLVPPLSDATGRIERGGLALESPGTGSVPSPTVGKLSKMASLGTGDGEDGGDSALLAALVALQRAGFSREQARALGLRFRNDDWARARAQREEDV